MTPSWLLFTLPPIAVSAPFDAVVAEVGGNLLLASDLPVEDALSAWEVPTFPLWSIDRAKALDRLVDSALLRAAASDLPLYQPDESEVRARLEALRSRFEQREAWEAFLRSLRIDEPTLQVALRRRMVAEKYLRRTLRSPEGSAAWEEELQQVLTDLRGRIRIRLITPLETQ